MRQRCTMRHEASCVRHHASRVKKVSTAGCKIKTPAAAEDRTAATFALNVSLWRRPRYFAPAPVFFLSDRASFFEWRSSSNLPKHGKLQSETCKPSLRRTFSHPHAKRAHSSRLYVRGTHGFGGRRGGGSIDVCWRRVRRGRASESPRRVIAFIFRGMLGAGVRGAAAR